MRFTRYIRSLRQSITIPRYGDWLFFGLLIGIVAGLGAIVFTFGIQLCNDFFFGTLAGYAMPSLPSEWSRVVEIVGETRRWFFFVIPALGGLIVGWLVYTYAPSLVIGGMLGGAFGEMAKNLLPSWEIEPSWFIMVGMAGFFAGIAKVPISAVIIVAEMTGSYGLLVPTMLVATITFLPTGKTSIYERQVAHRVESPAHRGEYLIDVLEEMSVRGCMVPKHPQQIVLEDLLLKDLLKRVSTTDHEYFVLIDETERLTGVIALDDVRRVLLDADLSGILVAKDLASPPRIKVSLDDTLSYALSLFTSSSVDEIPVLDGRSGEILGMVRKKDLIVAYNKELMKRKGSQVDK